MWPGRTYPLGATFDGFGTNFAVHSSISERVEPYKAWRLVMDTERGFAPENAATFAAGAEVPLVGRSLWLFRLEAP